jgi:hypothetical protein
VSSLSSLSKEGSSVTEEAPSSEDAAEDSAKDSAILSAEDSAEEAEDSISKDSAGCSSAPQAQANSKRKAVKSKQIRLGYANSRAIIISSQSGGRKTAQKIFISIPYFRPKKQLAKPQKMSERFWAFRQNCKSNLMKP